MKKRVKVELDRRLIRQGMGRYPGRGSRRDSLETLRYSWLLEERREESYEAPSSSSPTFILTVPLFS